MREYKSLSPYTEIGPGPSGGDFSEKFFVCFDSTRPTGDYNPDTLYLHTDGVWRHSTQCAETLKYSGYFETEEEALSVFEKVGEPS